MKIFNDPVILQTGHFRSGSAMVSRILNAHSKISMAQDKFKFFRFCFKRYEPLNDESIKKMLSDLNQRFYGRWSLNIDEQKCLKEITVNKNTYQSIYTTVLRNLYVDEDTPIIGEMEGSVWRNIPDFLTLFPNGKVLLLIRDLRDVVVSFKKITFAPGNDYLVSLFNVIDAMDHWLKYEKLYPEQFYGIRYEKIKLDPEPEVKRICQFLGINFEPEMLDEDKWEDLTNGGWTKWENRAVSGFHKEGDSKNPVGRWRKLISEEDLFLCEWLGRKQMKDFNIEREGGSFNRSVIKKAMNKIMSSDLLMDCFINWVETGGGVTRFPIDPLKPENWNQNIISNPEVFK